MKNKKFITKDRFVAEIIRQSKSNKNNFVATSLRGEFSISSQELEKREIAPQGAVTGEFMPVVNFISRHNIPTNFVDIIHQMGISPSKIVHVKDSVDSIIPDSGVINIAVAPTAMFIHAMNQMPRNSGIACFTMKRVRPAEGQPTCPPTEIESVTFAFKNSFSRVEIKEVI